VGRLRSQRGFTLFELLLTLGITTLALAGLIALHVSVVRANESAARNAEANEIGRATLEDLRAQTTPAMMNTLVGNPAAVPPVDVVRPPVVGRTNMSFRRRVLVTNVGGAMTALWRIRVEVGWTEDGAVQGSDGGRFDHLIAVELVRTREDAL
jgi:pilin/secretion family protein with methylation motif